MCGGDITLPAFVSFVVVFAWFSCWSKTSDACQGSVGSPYGVVLIDGRRSAFQRKESPGGGETSTEEPSEGPPQLPAVGISVLDANGSLPSSTRRGGFEWSAQRALVCILCGISKR